METIRELKTAVAQLKERYVKQTIVLEQIVKTYTLSVLQLTPTQKQQLILAESILIQDFNVESEEIRVLFNKITELQQRMHRSI